jgi:hypothetical protein
MKKIYMFISSVLFCAVCSYAQTNTQIKWGGPQFTDSIFNAQRKINDIAEKKDTLAQKFKTSAAQSAKPRSAAQETGALSEIDPAIRDGFLQFYSDTVNKHDKAYYVIMADHLAQAAKKENMLNGAVSFMDSTQFNEKFKGNEVYDFYKGFFDSEAKAHKTDKIIKHVQLVMFAGNKALSVSFVPFEGPELDGIYIHKWDINEKIQKLISFNVYPNAFTDNEIRAPLTKAGASIHNGEEIFGTPPYLRK